MVIPRSWTNPDALAAMKEFLRAPPPRRAAIHDLMSELLSMNPYARRCAADLARLVSAREPGILGNYADVLIGLVAETPLDQWQARGYITLAAALNARTRAQRLRLVALVRALAVDERNALRAIALEALATLAAADPELRDEATSVLENARRDGTSAMRTRARRMSLLLLESEKDPVRGRSRSKPAS